MANQKITDIVDPKAFQQVEKLSKDVALLTQQFVDLLNVVSKTTNATGFNPQTSQAIRAANAAMSEREKALQKVRREEERLQGIVSAFPGSLKALDAQTKLLIITRNKLTSATKEERDEMERLNQQISRNKATMKTHGDEITNQRNNIGNYGSAIKGIGLAMAAMATAVVAATAAIVGFGKESFKAYEDSLKEERLLLNAMNGRKDLTEELILQANALSKVTGVDDEDIISIQRLGAAHGLSVNQIKEVTKASLQLSAVTGQDLKGAAEQLLATYEGKMAKTLPKLSEQFAFLTKDQLRNGDAITLVNSKYQGYAEAAATSTGKLSVAWENLKESLGGFLDRIGTGSVLQSITSAINRGLKTDDQYIAEQKAATIAKKTSEELAIALAKEYNLKAKIATNDALSQGQKEREALRRAQTIALITAELKKRNELAVQDKEAKELKEKELAAAGATAKAEADAEKARESADRKAIADAQTKLRLQEENRKAVEAYGLALFLFREQQVRDAETLDKAKRDQAVKDQEEDDANFNRDSLTFNAAMNHEVALAKTKAETAEAEKKADEDKRKRLDEIAAKERFYAEAALEMFASIAQIQYNQKKGAIDQEIADLEKLYAAKLISEETYQKRKEALEARAKKLQHDKAVTDKQIAIFQATINTAVAVTQALYNPIMAAIIAALGAAQIAAIISQPIPKYEKGRKGGKGELAYVHPGEIVTDGQRAYRTPSREALTYLPEGASVIPRHEVELMTKVAFSGITTTDNGQPGYDLTKLTDQLARDNEALRRTIKDKETITEVKMRGLYEGLNWDAYVNQNFRR